MVQKISIWHNFDWHRQTSHSNCHVSYSICQTGSPLVWFLFLTQRLPSNRSSKPHLRNYIMLPKLNVIKVIFLLRHFQRDFTEDWIRRKFKWIKSYPNFIQSSERYFITCFHFLKTFKVSNFVKVFQSKSKGAKSILKKGYLVMGAIYVTTLRCSLNNLHFYLRFQTTTYTRGLMKI